MDLAVTFHVGSAFGSRGTEKQKVSAGRIRGSVMLFLVSGDASDALGQAQNVAD